MAVTSRSWWPNTAWTRWDCEMKIPTLIQAAKGKAELQFCSRRGANYVLSWWDEGQLEYMPFTVPWDDAGDGDFYHNENGLTLMRWIRKHLEMIDAGKKEHEAYLKALEAENP